MEPAVTPVIGHMELLMETRLEAPGRTSLKGSGKMMGEWQGEVMPEPGMPVDRWEY
ncbi:MAG: hypothetical protein M1399_09455 [Actinobacteria bacterium]|nr:hypothetical protein [Actinomycetota bacterium]MCL5447344.1 hypothetical protein [Actinomycetota bacterium]